MEISKIAVCRKEIVKVKNGNEKYRYVILVVTGIFIALLKVDAWADRVLINRYDPLAQS